MPSSWSCFPTLAREALVYVNGCSLLKRASQLQITILCNNRHSSFNFSFLGLGTLGVSRVQGPASLSRSNARTETTLRPFGTSEGLFPGCMRHAVCLVVICRWPFSNLSLVSAGRPSAGRQLVAERWMLTAGVWMSCKGPHVVELCWVPEDSVIIYWV